MTTQTYPKGPKFSAKYTGTCAFSGMKIYVGDEVRTLVDGYDAATDTYANPRIVLNRYVDYACDSANWRRFSDAVSASSLAGNNHLYIVSPMAWLCVHTLTWDGDAVCWRENGSRKRDASVDKLLRESVCFRVGP